MDTVLVPLTLVAGGLLPLQAGANAQLAKATRSPFAATSLQLLVGALILSLLALVTGSFLAFGRLPDVTWWHLAGGIASAFYVVSGILLFPRLGAVVTVGLFIAGQMLASIGLDVSGALGVPTKTFGALTFGGLVAVLAGAAAIVSGQAGGAAPPLPRRAAWIALALIVGALLPVQGAINALLRTDLVAPFAVGVISFVIATLTMSAILAATTLLAGAPQPRLAGITDMPWWGWLGGFAGATYVTAVFTAIPAIGTAATIGLTVAGQQIVSVLVDRYGWFRLPQRPISALRLAGIAALLAGVTAMQIA